MTAGRNRSARCTGGVCTWPKAARIFAASLQQDGEGVLLRLPGAGGGWRLRAEGAKITLEESVYLGGPEARRGEQVVLSGFADGAQQVKWAITKVG
jgi:uncharacterized heparinase superfamily protein